MIDQLKNLAELQGALEPTQWTLGGCNGRGIKYGRSDADVAEFDLLKNATFATESRNIDLPALVAYVESLQNDIGKLVIQRESLKQHLSLCLDWMEQMRASGDGGNWNWSGDSEYTQARQALKQEG